MSYEAFAKRIVDTGILTDPWIFGQPRFREEPVVLSRASCDGMYRAAERVAEVYNELCAIVSDAPELCDDFFCLSPYQKAMWQASQPLWHGIARADVFVTKEGLAFAELNCDTPTGEAEAVLLNALVAKDHPGTVDPNEGLEERFCSMLALYAEASLDGPAGPGVGLVYPTEFSEDLSLVRLYRRWLERRGREVVLGSPYNLRYGDSGPLLFDVPVPLLVRHYKTDWWGERSSAWDDGEIPDTAALVGPLGVLLRGSLERKAAIVNPLGSVVAQNKRAMAFMWEHIHRFSPGAQAIIEAHIPVTSRLEVLHKEQLLAQQEDWVLKSAYGAEGEEVVIGRLVTPDVWRASLAHAREGSWIAQRFFAATETERGETVNHGVFLVAGEAAAIYTRIQAGPTDERALSAPTLIAG